MEDLQLRKGGEKDSWKVRQVSLFTAEHVGSITEQAEIAVHAMQDTPLVSEDVATHVVLTIGIYIVVTVRGNGVTVNDAHVVQRVRISIRSEVVQHEQGLVLRRVTLNVSTLHPDGDGQSENQTLVSSVIVQSLVERISTEVTKSRRREALFTYVWRIKRDVQTTDGWIRVNLKSYSKNGLAIRTVRNNVFCITKPFKTH